MDIEVGLLVGNVWLVKSSGCALVGGVQWACFSGWSPVGML